MVPFYFHPSLELNSFIFASTFYPRLFVFRMLKTILFVLILALIHFHQHYLIDKQRNENTLGAFMSDKSLQVSSNLLHIYTHLNVKRFKFLPNLLLIYIQFNRNCKKAPRKHPKHIHDSCI